MEIKNGLFCVTGLSRLLVALVHAFENHSRQRGNAIQASLGFSMAVRKEPFESPIRGKVLLMGPVHELFQLRFPSPVFSLGHITLPNGGRHNENGQQGSKACSSKKWEEVFHRSVRSRFLQTYRSISDGAIIFFARQPSGARPSAEAA